MYWLGIYCKKKKKSTRETTLASYLMSLHIKLG